jgi:hypothetical protein
MARWIALFSVVCVGALGACGDDDGPSDDPDSGRDGGEDRDSGPAAGSGGRGGSGGGVAGSSGTMAPMPVECGGQTCAMPMGGFGMACCTPDDECGVDSIIAPGTCLPQGAPGGIDSSCPPFELMAGMGITLYGCCTPDGECGALSTGATGRGCVANSILMAPPESCDYDPNNTCQRLFEVNCDGAEDCPSGQQCCGHYDGGYRSFECADSCAAEQAEQMGTWSEVCHPGDTCEAPDGGTAAYTCLANLDFLPEYLFRCRDTGTEPGPAGSAAAGEINCGENVCSAGQKCCISVPGLAVCVPSSQDCACVTTEPDDAGTTGDDAGR